MITRPLELASRLRPEPRSLDALFFVNAGLLVLFFSLFGSRFVLAPGLDVNLPQMAGARGGATTATHHISVTRSGLIFVKAGPVTIDELKTWLADEGKAWQAQEGKRNHRPVLLVRASAEVPGGLLAKIVSAADSAGFSVTWAEEEPAANPGGGR